MNTETEILMALVLAVLIVAALYAAASEGMNMGGETLDEYREGVTEPVNAEPETETWVERKDCLEVSKCQKV